MATASISYGVEIWLADLARSGWTLTVSEQRGPGVPVVRDGELLPTLASSPSQVGVLACRLKDGCEGVGHFVPCASEREAWRLLERVEAENQQ